MDWLNTWGKLNVVMGTWETENVASRDRRSVPTDLATAMNTGVGGKYEQGSRDPGTPRSERVETESPLKD